MQFNETTNTITTYRYDYGIPITFDAGVEQGFSVGDQIVIVFDDDRIEDRDDITVNVEDFSFELKLTEKEAQAVIDRRVIPYSIKRMRDGKFLETLLNGNIEFRSTLKWQN
nr:hypothetical protein [uncultured Ruminococcus sp.]